jgi:hypothetical protein
MKCKPEFFHRGGNRGIVDDASLPGRGDPGWLFDLNMFSYVYLSPTKISTIVLMGQRARLAGHARHGDGTDAPETPARTSAHWQRLIRKVYEADPLLCPDCGGPMRVVSLVDLPMLIEGTLREM